MSLRGIAKETQQIVEAGAFVGPAGQRVDLAAAIGRAVSGTRLYTPSELIELLDRAPVAAGSAPPCVVSAERTQQAARRLVADEGLADLVLLNFASARNPGGGWLRGAKAQEEDLARASALAVCVESQPGYYQANRRERSLLYTDHLIHSPGVPFFRGGPGLLDRPFEVAVITAPAPNAGQVLRRDPQATPRVEACLRRRAGMVLAVAQARGHRNLLLGAWGCGVFRNQPAVVADAFGRWLESPRFAGAFDQVSFAIYDRTREQANLRAFERRFSG
jgi:uncharacterized protein (TIGR02452 family)